MRKLINQLICALCIFLSSQVALGFSAEPLKMLSLKRNSQTIEVTYQKQLALNIADAAINRISFDQARVSKVIGNVSGSTSILSDDGSNLFITPNMPEKSKIDFAVLLSSGDIIDMSLTVVKSTKPYLISLKFPDHSNDNSPSEVSSLIEAMRNGVISKYYVQKASSNVAIPGKEGIKATSGNIYRFGKLKGTILTLQNKGYRSKRGKAPAIEIAENDLIGAFKGVVGVHIENSKLNRGEKTKAYIVSQEGA